jgi:hypothetical protein
MLSLASTFLVCGPCLRSTTAHKPATPPMPVQRSAPEFEVCILPHLSMPKRGLKCTLGSCRVFDLLWTEPPPKWQHLRWAVSPAILAGGYAPLRKQLRSVLAGHLAHERGATCRASACLPPHSPPYWGSRSARRSIYGVRPISWGSLRHEERMLWPEFRWIWRTKKT